MESWQVDQINHNLPSLLSNTDCNIQLLAELKSRKLLSDVDFELIRVEKTRQCKANLMYDILKSRTNAYYELINSLTATKQTGVAKILMRISTDRLKSLRIAFLGYNTELNHLLDNRQIDAIQEWLNVKMPSDDLLKVNQCLADKEHLQLLTNTIPEPYSLYIPRLLTRRLVVNPKAFERMSPDIFVFKNISQPQLRNIVRREIDSSTNQVRKRKVTAQFIILDSESDWERICRKVDCSAHLIRYDELINVFELERTLGCSMEFYKYLQQKGDSISEDMFVDTCFEKRKNLCICDSPGMGKSLLLANLAQKVQKRYPNRIVSFIQLKDLIPEEENVCRGEMFCIKSKLFEIISTSVLASRILHEITKNNDTNFELFLDGLDEVQGYQLEPTILFLRTLSESMPNARIYITSRPIMRNVLEKTFGVISYGIQPFLQETQIRFHTSYWVEHNSISNVCKLNEYATTCLRNVVGALKEKEKAITGIPLLCRLIAEVYAEEAEIYADPARTVAVQHADFTATSLLQIYSKYVQNTLKETRCNFECMYVENVASAQCGTDCSVRNFHVWKALELIFPKFAKKLALLVPISVMSDSECLTSEQWDNLKILSPGLLIRTNNAGVSKVEFVHRTFAEYLVAEYFVKTIIALCSGRFQEAISHKEILYLFVEEIFSSGRTKTPSECRLINIAKHIYTGCRDVIRLIFCIADQFLHENVVAYFKNAMIAQNSRVVGHLRTVEFPIRIQRCLLNALPGCVRQDYEMLIDIISNIKPLRITWFLTLDSLDIWGGMHIKRRMYTTATTTLNLAVKYCNLITIKKLVQFFSGRCFLDNKLFNDMLITAIQRADYDIFCLIFKKLELEKRGFLSRCVKFTYREDEDLVEKKLAIAEFLTTKHSELLTESCGLWDCTHSYQCKCPLLSPQIHLKAVKFLVSKGANIWEADHNGQTVIHSAAGYMSSEQFSHLCYFVFVECKAKNILLEPTLWKKFFYTVGSNNGSNGVSTKKLVYLLLTLHSLEPDNQTVVCNKDGTAKLLTHFDLQVLLKALLENQSFHSKYEQEFLLLFYVALLEGNVEVVEHFLSYNHLLLEMEFEHENNKTPLMIAIKYERVNLICFLITKGADVYVVDKLGNTILHLLAYTRNCSLFHEVFKVLGRLMHDSLRKVKPATCSQNFASTRSIPRNLTELFNWKKDDRLRTPLNYAMYYIPNISLETLQLFLADWSKPNIELFGLLGHDVLRVCRRRYLYDHYKYFVELGCSDFWDKLSRYIIILSWLITIIGCLIIDNVLNN